VDIEVDAIRKSTFEVRAERPMNTSEAALRSALEAIVAGGDCACDHDDENCCARVDEYCPVCIAAEVLAARATSEPPPVTPEMMSEVFAQSVHRRNDPNHQHIYDHRTAAELLNKMLRAAASGKGSEQ
jgi:hypothetical protein